MNDFEKLEFRRKARELAVKGAVLATLAGGAALGGIAHASGGDPATPDPIVSATDGNTMTTNNNTAAAGYIKGTAFGGLVLGLIVLAWVLRVARAAKRGKIPRV